MALPDLDHPSWPTVGATLVAYTAILLAMFLLLFVVPYLVFRFT